MTESSTTAPIITIRNVWKYFDSLPALQDVSLDIAPGERVVIIGPSGSGKSTLLRSINRLEEIDQGKIVVKGQDIMSPDNDINLIRQNLGMVFQQFNLFERKTALDNVKEGLKIVKRMDDASATALAKEELRKVGLSERENHYPRHLSGGQKQRVALARALAMQPDILLLDEPTSALDPELVGEVERSIADAAKTGQTMILVSHDMNFIYQVADKVLFLENGRILEQGTPEELFHHPKEERTREFFASYSNPQF